MMRGFGSATLLLVALIAAPVSSWASEDNVDTERTLSDILQDKRLQEAKARGDVSGRDTTIEEEEARRQREKIEGRTESRRAILPQIGFSPEKGASGGIKFTDRDIGGLTLDVSGLAAQQGQYKAKMSLVAPDVAEGWVIAAGFASFETDPARRFFGLGNNDIGPDEISRNGYKRMNLRLVGALRLTYRVALVASLAYNDVRIRRGARHDDTPSTQDLFPNLLGIHGGKTNPLSAAIIFDDRDDVTRPTRGWNVIAKTDWVPRDLSNDFDFTRYTFEASYLYPLLTRRQVLGVRVGGDYIDTKRRHTPYFEFSSLGGGDDMRGYFLDRFLGKAKFIGGGEYRLKIFDFNFFNIWDVKIDGVAFGDAGRVFLSRDDMASEFGVDETQLPKLKNKMRFSYGGGVRFALGEATLARVDVGFSEEQKGLVYLVFGHTF
jgi:outer membrane protein assembly factor BamA